MTWTPSSPPECRLVQDDNLFLLELPDGKFTPSYDLDAIGALCFAYGLDNTLFDGVRPDEDMRRWLIWHFSALVSHSRSDPDLPSFMYRALERAAALAPDAMTAQDIRERFIARDAAIAQELGTAPLC